MGLTKYVVPEGMLKAVWAEVAAQMKSRVRVVGTSDLSDCADR